MVELPSSLSELIYDVQSFHKFRQAVSSVDEGNPGEAPEVDDDEKERGEIDEQDRRPLLQEALAETGYHVNLTTEQIKGRFFAVIDGNHRLQAIKSPQVRDSQSQIPQVRCGIVKMQTILHLIETGTLVNMIRGIQAEENFYDRFLWVCPLYDEFVLSSMCYRCVLDKDTSRGLHARGIAVETRRMGRKAPQP